MDIDSKALFSFGSYPNLDIGVTKRSLLLTEIEMIWQVIYQIILYVLRSIGKCSALISLDFMQ